MNQSQKGQKLLKILANGLTELKLLDRGLKTATDELPALRLLRKHIINLEYTIEDANLFVQSRMIDDAIVKRQTNQSNKIKKEVAQRHEDESFHESMERKRAGLSVAPIIPERYTAPDLSDASADDARAKINALLGKNQATIKSIDEV